MKKYAYFALCLVLTASVLVGCGCTNQNQGKESAPSVLPTNEEVWDTTESTTRATTESTMSTRPSETMDRGNGPLEDPTTGTSDSTESTETTQASGAAEGRSRSMVPGMR